MRPRSSEMKASEEVDQAIAPCRGRPTSKLKVLGRSHAMREEQSPPREPTAEENPPQLQSPPTVILSPSPVEAEEHPHGSPSKTSSARAPHSEEIDGYERLHPLEIDPNPKRAATEPSTASLQNRNFCDCQHQTCIKCLKERGGNNNHSNLNHNVLQVGRNRGKLRQQSSSQTSLSFESSSGTSPSLSRDSSADHYTDTTGADLERFIPATINRCAKDRALMLRIEEELLSLINDQFQSHYKFPPMSSYHRMLVHRCAAYFGMDHNIDQLGKCIIVNKTKNTRLPEVRFKDHIKEMFNDEPPRRSILKRDSNSMEDYFKSTDSGYGMEVRRSKSFEERELEYKKAKRRIFEMQESAEDIRWAELEWSSTECEFPRYRAQPPPADSQSRQLRKLLKVQSEEAEQSMRPCVAKSFSFGGYGGGGVSILTRGDSVSSARLLSKQDSGTSSIWRLSPSSSGYKSQSQVSESATPSPTSTPQPPDENEQQLLNKGAGNPVMWAVSDLSHVPKGSIIFNPGTGKPYKNDDGTIYYYDPEKPAPAGLMFNDVESHEQELDDVITPQREKTPMPSPKHHHQKSLPLKTQRHARAESSFTNSATSPSLPYSPSPSHSSVSLGRNYSYLQAVHPCDASNAPPQHFTEFSSNPTPEGGNVPLYTPPYIVYTATPYGVPVQQQFDSRLGLSSMTEISTTYFVPDGGASAAPPPIGYPNQPAGSFWNQSPLSFYPNASQPPTQPAGQRYAPQEQQGFAPAAFPAVVNYVPAQQAAPQQGGEMVPIYANQSVHMLYPQGPPTGGVIYQNQPSFAYAPNAASYQPTGFSGHGITGYVHANPNSGPPSVSSTPFESNGLVQLAQNMQQMSLGAGPPSAARGFVPVNPKYPQSFDPRRGSLPKPALNFSKRPAMMGSSHSSTGTSSPATTVVASTYCPAQFQTPPPSTPPTPQYVFNSMPPRLFRQMSGDRGPTPGTAKSSRSPTPAVEGSPFDRQRFAYPPPNVCHGFPMPYLVQDPRLLGRGQPGVYRHATPPMPAGRQPMSLNDNRSHTNKNRRPRSQKMGGLPPSGKQ